MRPVTKPLALGLLSLSLATPCPARSEPPAGQITLMQTLSEWAYPGTMEPGTKLPGETSMRDGGDPRQQSVKMHAVLATPDPFEKVVAFYAEKLKAGGPAGPNPARSVAVQDDSKGRPVALRVFVVNAADTSTTLVISRAEGEKETHIAWSHWIRLGGVR